jgi:hypothetical protein
MQFQQPFTVSGRPQSVKHTNRTSILPLSKYKQFNRLRLAFVSKVETLGPLKLLGNH